MNSKKLYPLFRDCTGISTDTRTITSGSIFFALKGPNFDGNTYASQAIKNGAAYAVIDNIKYKKGKKYLLVADVLTSLQNLASYHRSKLEIPIIGISGSNGKTTTKELIKNVLDQKYKVQSTKGNLNNHIGVPLTLLSIDKSHDIAIVEMGTNSTGEISVLAKMAMPTHGLLTSIGKAHLEGLGSLEGVAKEKFSLLDQIVSDDGFIFLNQDDPRIAKYKQAKKDKRLDYSLNGIEGICRIEVEATFPELSISISKSRQTKINIVSPLLGRYNAINVIAAVTVGLHFGVNLMNIATGISNYIPNNNRTQRIQYENATVYLDAYNANPTSMKLAIEAIAMSKSSRKKILVLGDMLEVGSDSAQEHQSIVNYIQQFTWKYIILVGPRFAKTMAQTSINIFKIETSEVLRSFLLSKSLKGTVILVKGSRSMKLERGFVK